MMLAKRRLSMRPLLSWGREWHAGVGAAHRGKLAFVLDDPHAGEPMILSSRTLTMTPGRRLKAGGARQRNPEGADRAGDADAADSFSTRPDRGEVSGAGDGG